MIKNADTEYPMQTGSHETVDAITIVSQTTVASAALTTNPVRWAVSDCRVITHIVAKLR